MTVYLVGAGPGDPGLLTRRGAQLLRRADVVLHDRLVSPAVLDLVPPSAELVDVGKMPDGVGRPAQEEIGRLLVEHGRRSATVVRLKGGDPFLFGRGGEETEVLDAAGIDWEVVPGVTSAFGVPAALGIPVTQRGLASSVTVVTGRVGETGGAGSPDWEALARAGGTLVVLMGMTTRDAVADALIRGGRAPDTPVAVIGRGTLPAEQVVRTTLAGLAGVELEAPAVIVIGPVAALGRSGRDAPSGGPLAGRTVVATRSGQRARGLVDGLEEAGAVVIQLPLTRTADPADGGDALRAAAAALASFDWVVFTSQNAVDRLMATVRDARALAGVAVAAVGPATADALRLAGVEPDLVPAEHSARGLVEEFAEGRGRVLFPCANLGPRHRRRRASRTRGGRWSGSRPTAPCRLPRPTRRSWIGWPRPMPSPSPPPPRCWPSPRCPGPTARRCRCRRTSCASDRPRPPPPGRPAWPTCSRPGARQPRGMVRELVDHFGDHPDDAS